MIITFFSYKGGAGRSLSLANTAALLASEGRNVGMIDLDLDSPGLHHIFRVKPREDRSLLDLLLGGFVAGLERVAIDVRSESQEDWRGKEEGGLWLVPTVAEIRKLSRLHWNEATFAVFNDIVEHFIRVFQLDHLLIDSRTGYSVSASNAFSVSDAVACIMRLNDQSIHGVRQLVTGFEGVGKPYVMVASSVPESDLAAKYLDKYEKQLGGKSFDVILPYDERLAFEERLLGLEFPESSYARGIRLLAGKLEGDAAWDG